MSTDALGRRAVVIALQQNPHWTLDQLAEVLRGGRRRARQLAAVTIRELCSDWPFNPRDYDRAVLQILAAVDEPVAAGFLRACVGGRRWTLLESMKRLEARGLVEISGKTSARRYRLVARG